MLALVSTLAASMRPSPGLSAGGLLLKVLDLESRKGPLVCECADHEGVEHNGSEVEAVRRGILRQ